MMTDDPKTARPSLLKGRTRKSDWRRADMAKYTAYLAVRRALGSGMLQRQGCEVCSRDAVDAHHDRYGEPLNVRLHCHGDDMFPVRRPSPEGQSHED